MLAMIEHTLDRMRRSVSDLGRRIGLTVAGLVLLAVALGFLTASAWVALSAALTAAQIALLFGLAYSGAGLILISLARHRRRAPRVPDQSVREAVAEAQALGAAAAGAKAGYAAGLNAALGETVAAKGPLPALMGAFLLGLEVAARLSRRPR